MINCLIVEDERPAQKVLKTYIGDMANLQLVDCCNNALTAMEVLRHQDIQLIFLDIHLPKLSGLNFLRTLISPPKVIITSAYPQYALEGFELDVMDYLLKPFSFERFIKAVNKYPTPATIVSTPNTISPPPAITTAEKHYLFVKQGRRLQKIAYDDILFMQSEKDFVKIFTEEKFHLELQSLKYYAALLPDNFLRVHKSYLVNLDRLMALEGNIIKIQQHDIPIGRNYKEALWKKLDL